MYLIVYMKKGGLMGRRKEFNTKLSINIDRHKKDLAIKFLEENGMDLSNQIRKLVYSFSDLQEKSEAK